MSAQLSLEPRLRADQARVEATRCLQCCDAPCVAACPAGIVIPRFIRMVASGNDAGAAKVVRSSHPLALSCGYACPDEQLCGAACLRAAIDRPIEIRRLHRYATEVGEGKGLKPAPTVLRGRPGDAGASSLPASTRGAKRPPKAGPQTRARRVAVVGAGPAGLSCAFELRRAGVAVTLFEERARFGGVLGHTIPLYRFPDEAIARDGTWALGEAGEVELKLSHRVADPAGLRKEFDAVFLGVGVRDSASTWEGSDLGGVSGAEEFLARTRASRYRNRIGSEIAVIGGGNVAIDAAMAAVRCAEAQGRPTRVHLLYRRTRREMPAWDREVSLAENAGVMLQFLVQPGRFVGEKGKLLGIELARTRLAASSGKERPRPEVIPGNEFLFACDQAILATGQTVDGAWRKLLPLTRDGYLRVRGTTWQVGDGIFAAGDAVGGEQKIVTAVRDGRRAARAILAWLEGGRR